MAKFAYRIQDANAEVLEGILEAPSEAQAQKFLIDQKFEVLSLKEQRQGFNLEAFLARFKRVNAVQFNFFVRQLATMLRSGVPMLPALITLQEGAKDAKLRDVLEDVYKQVEKGTSFSQAIARHPSVFNPLFVSTVKSGEAIGEMDTVLIRLADILEKDYQTQSKIKAALRYPMFAAGTMFLAFLVATLFIIPRFKTLFTSFGAELPLPTKILLGTSDFLLGYWYIALALFVSIVIALIWHYRTHQGRRFWDGLMIRLPIFGEFIRNAVFARFSRMLGMMLKSGVNILQGLDLISEIVGNAVLSDSILRLKQQVEQGNPMAEQMRRESLYPVLIVQLARVGEESGKLDELMSQIADFYDAELEVMVKNVEAMIEPVFIVVLGIFVTIMALGIFLPMWNLFSVIQSAAM